MAQKQEKPTITRKGGDNGGSKQDQDTPVSLERPEVEGAIGKINEVLKRTKSQQPRRSGCGCGW